MHINPNWLAFAIINTLIALFFVLNAIAQKRSTVSAIPNGLLACLFWWMAFCA